MSAPKQMVPKIQGPFGLRWLWRLMFGHGFWVGFATAFFITPFLVQAIGTAWSGDVPSFQEHYKSFIIGDPLLAIVVGLLAVLAQTSSSVPYVLPRHYWKWWFAIGLFVMAVFVWTELLKDKIALHHLLEPKLFYHHLLLVTVYVMVIGGMAYVQYRRHPRHKIWIVILLLAAGFVSLLAYDNFYPPLNS